MSGSQQLLLGGVPTPVPVDPYFYSVTSLLHGDGTNGGQNNTFLDSSSNNFTITRNGNTTQGSFSPFSQTGWGNFFDGSGDYLTFTANSTTSFTGDLTLEGWVFLRSFAGSLYNECCFASLRSSVSAGTQFDFGRAGGSYGAGNIMWWHNNAVICQGSAGDVPLNQWVHVAWVRSGTGANNCKIYVNGVQKAQGTNTTTMGLSSGTAYLGSSAFDQPVDGYISNLRMTNTAVYTAAFTPPTAPLTAISGTSLLTCQANRFLDASSNAFAITRNGDVSVQPFSPFNPITPYSTSSIGGSGYFDGSGDSLTFTDSSNALDLGGATASVEFWVYAPNVSSGQGVFNKSGGTDSWNTTNGYEYNIYITGGTINFYYNNAGTGTTGVSGSIVASQWTHVAVATNSSNAISLYINGSRVSTATNAITKPSTRTTMRVGNTAVNEYFSGYLSGLRLISGSGAYDASQTTIAIPTAPPTAVTNTAFLLNFTNGAIFDNAAVADYETVGNAQISTSVKKYGTGSMAFDGTGDYLVTYAPSTQSFAFGTGDFTVEFWYYSNNSGVQQILYDSRPSGTNGVYITLYKTSGNVIELYVNNGVRLTGTTTLSSGVWYHIALCRVASQTKIFVNGTQSGPTYADTNSYLNGTNRPVIGSDSATVGNLPLNGYIDDLRVSKGIGRYPYNFTPPTAEFPNIGGTITLTADPYFDYTTLLLPGNGTNGSQNNTFLDSSTNAFSITRNGNTTQGTFSPFSQTGWGNYFDGSGDYLTVPSNTAFAFNGAYTVEFWLYPLVQYGSSSVVGFFCETTTGGLAFYIDNSSRGITLASRGVSNEITTGQYPTANSWNHVVVCRDGSNNTSIYLNGSRIGTASLSTSYASSGGIVEIGTLATTTYPLTGYMSNLRVVKGTAVYDPTQTTLTVPTTPLTAISGTSLLTCQSNRFIDNSSNAFAITRNGDVSVQAFSPFNPTAAWSASTNGGSGYFDGSGDYLTTTTSSAFDLSSGDWTIQGWYYPTAYSAGNNVLIYVGTSAGDKIVIADISTGGSGLWYLLNGSSAITSSTKAPLNAWSFFALVKSGSTTTLYLNGVSLGTTTSVPTSSNKSVNLGSDAGAAVFQGYFADIRILKGTANTAVPTAPLTAITNTSLLLNFTNAGIYDATSKNDLETVGNAQISTTQSKFGGSSMYFDGTGDYLNIPQTPLLEFGSGDFTAEAWVYLTSSSASTLFWLEGEANANLFAALRLGADTGKIYLLMSTNNSTWAVNSGLIGSSIVNQWAHVAVTRYGNDVKVFVNGVQIGSTYTVSGALMNGSINRIGQLNSTEAWTGYIQDARITRGIARYTSNFTPPTTAFLTL